MKRSNSKKPGSNGSRYAPYGYDFGPDGALVENHHELQRLKWMRNLRSRGHSYQDIADQLNAHGRPAKAGGKWGASSVRSVLEKPRPPWTKAKDDDAPRVDINTLSDETTDKGDLHDIGPYGIGEDPQP